MKMKDLFEEILDLQREYTNKSSPSMIRRGVLIRDELPNTLREIQERLVLRMGSTGHDLDIKGRDQTGQMSEIPWVRIYSKSRSPKPTEGWYCVLLFSGDGSGFYLSLGHGSTRWEEGRFVPRSDEELDSLVQWSRDVLEKRTTLDPRLLQTIDLKFTKSKVAKSYQRGTSIAFWYDRNSLPSDTQFVSDLETLLSMLSVLYDELDLGRTPDSGSLLVRSHLEIVRSPSGGSSRSNRQGWGLSSKEKKVVEDHSMRLSETRLRELGYTNLKDVSSTSPFDFTVEKDGVEYIVEVKGTTGRGEIVLLTVNEVESHRSRYPHNILIVVHSIDLDRSTDTPTPSGGEVEMVSSWTIEESRLRPLTFSYRRDE
jgi:hypothetical protein